MSCCNLLSSKDGDPEDSRIVFSTYQTMINCIDTVKSKMATNCLQQDILI